MVFTPSAPKDQESPAWATQLTSALQKARCLQRAPNLRSWIQEFNTLKTQVPPARIQRVLSWYCECVGQPGMLKAFSARSFRFKFDELEQAMSETERDPLTCAVVTEIAQRIAGRLAQRSWPMEIAPHLPVLVQLSRDALSDFTGHAYRHYTQIKSIESEHRNTRFLEVKVLEEHLYPDMIEEEWFYLHYERIGKFQHYGGSILKLVFDPRSKMFLESYWRGWAMEWAGQEAWGAFDPLLRQILQGLGNDRPRL